MQVELRTASKPLPEHPTKSCEYWFAIIRDTGLPVTDVVFITSIGTRVLWGSTFGEVRTLQPHE